MANDIPVLVIEDEEGNITHKEFRKAVSSNGKMNIKTFYRLVKTFLLKPRIDKNMSLSFSSSFIYSDIDTSDINNVLEKIIDLYNGSNHFSNLHGENIPIDIFLEFVNDRTDRTLLRLYNVQAVGKKEWKAFNEEFGDKMSSYSSGDVYYVDNSIDVIDTMLYMKIKYPDLSYQYKVYSMKDGVIEIE